MRTLLILSALLPCSAAALAEPALVCGTPGAPPEFKLPAYTVSEKTPECDRRIDFAYARTGKKVGAFMKAQRRIHQDVSDVLGLQGGALCLETLKSYAALRERQYAALAKALAAELQEEVGSCAVVAVPKTAPVRTPEPDDAPAPAPPHAPMIEPI
ncbi:MAG: hypothetical protein KGJ84_13775 [Elusimicrobia bacterium]|nr:hypothetical protein [Elusimicrobiota bacterium]